MPTILDVPASEIKIFRQLPIINGMIIIPDKNPLPVALAFNDAVVSPPSYIPSVVQLGHLSKQFHDQPYIETLSGEQTQDQLTGEPTAASQLETLKTLTY